MEVLMIRYVGTKPRCHDSVADTGLTWTPGQVHAVPLAAAYKLLKHADVWARDDSEQVEPAEVDAALAQVEQTEQAERAERQMQEAEMPPPVMPPVQNLDKPQLIELARTRFGEELDPGMHLSTMRKRLRDLENSGRQRGV